MRLRSPVVQCFLSTSSVPTVLSTFVVSAAAASATACAVGGNKKNGNEFENQTPIFL